MRHVYWNLLLVLSLILTGCGSGGVATYRVADPTDKFTQTVDGVTVSFADWKLTVDGKVIDIPPKESTIQIHQSPGHLRIDVDGKAVYEK